MAVQVYNGLFVGNASDIYRFAGSVLHCARDPWFEVALKVHDPLWAYNTTVGTAVKIAYNEMALSSNERTVESQSTNPSLILGEATSGEVV